MPIPLITIVVVGLLSFLWPGPKLNHKPPKNGGVFAPDVFYVARSSAPAITTFEASATIPASTDTTKNSPHAKI